MDRGEFLVACLCARWCHICNAYQAGFLALAARFPGAEFRWIDIEDEAELVGDFEVEDFPTLLVQRAERVLFYGPMPPMHGHLARMLDMFAAQSAEESRAYALGSDERRSWQDSRNLRALLEGS